MHYLGWMLLILLIQLMGCSTTTVYAPVVEASTIEALPKKGMYRVHRDDTLYSIAWRYGFDYRYLANLNHISPPYHIVPGQLILLKKIKLKMPAKKFLQPPMKQSFKSQEYEPTQAVSHWYWPAKGKVVSYFSGLHKGINIQGEVGESIYATAPGKVVYSGNGLRAYGNLIIIKHNSAFLSAYAYNKTVLVQEGQRVKARQVIATMGMNRGQSILHFEIRRGGKPVNPLSYLGKK